MSITTALTHLNREDALLTTQEAAIVIGVTSWRVKQRIATGELRAIKVGGAGSQQDGGSTPRTSTPS